MLYLDNLNMRYFYLMQCIYTKVQETKDTLGYCFLILYLHIASSRQFLMMSRFRHLDNTFKKMVNEFCCKAIRILSQGY